jgi:hypothetical protein
MSYILLCILVAQTVLHSRVILGPGGYFDSQTTDTQFFTAAPRCSSPHHAEGDIENSDTAMVVNSLSTLLPGTSGATAPSQTAPDSPDQRSRGPKAKWDRLDKIIDGPDYADGRHWTMFPVLRRHRPGTDDPARALKWLYDTSREEIDLVDTFCFKFRALAGAQTPHNSVQGESIFITFFLARIIPFFARAIMDSDLVRMRELVSVGCDLLQAIEILANVEEGARDRLNAEVNEEIAKLDGLDVRV